MSAPTIRHVTMTTGHTCDSSRAEVADDVMATLRAWLSAAAQSGKPLPLPEPFDAYPASILIDGGSLVATIYSAASSGQPRIKPLPLCVIGVSQDQQPALWSLLIELHGQRAAPQPAAPWCAVALLPPLALDQAAAQWLGDFERCLAWAWIGDHPSLKITQ